MTTRRRKLPAVAAPPPRRGQDALDAIAGAAARLHAAEVALDDTVAQALGRKRTDPANAPLIADVAATLGVTPRAVNKRYGTATSETVTDLHPHARVVWPTSTGTRLGYLIEPQPHDTWLVQPDDGGPVVVRDRVLVVVGEIDQLGNDSKEN